MRTATVFEAIQLTIRVILHSNQMMATNERFVLIEPTISHRATETREQKKNGAIMEEGNAKCCEAVYATM